MTLPGFEDYTFDVTPLLEEDARRLWEYLNDFHKGFENKITAIPLHKAACLNGGKNAKKPDSYVRKVVNTLRKWTCPVGSHQGGYWACVNVAELQMTEDHLLGRGNSIRSAYDGLQIAKERMSHGQQEMRL